MVSGLSKDPLRVPISREPSVLEQTHPADYCAVLTIYGENLGNSQEPILGRTHVLP